jgi:hypothetical protein
MNQILAFHNDKKVRSKYINRVKAHQEADEIIKGKYWEKGKGCAVGCTIEGSDHDRYPTELGISWRLALIEDSLFENLPNGEAKKFPLQFLQAVQLGSDTELVYKKFVIWVLGDKKDGLVNVVKDEKQKDLLNRILKLYKKSLTKEIKQSEWKKLADEASAYASASASAYASASASAYAYAYAYASVYAYAYASVSAYAYASAYVYASAYASVSAYAYASAYASAYAYGTKEWQEVFDKRIFQMRDKLLELLKEAK